MGYYYDAKKDMLLETYKLDAPFKTGYLGLSWELNMHGFQVAKRKRKVDLFDVETSWNKKLPDVIPNPDYWLVSRDKTGTWESITTFHDIIDYQTPIRMIAKRHHLLNYYETYRDGWHLANESYHASSTLANESYPTGSRPENKSNSTRPRPDDQTRDDSHLGNQTYRDGPYVGNFWECMRFQFFFDYPEGKFEHDFIYSAQSLTTCYLSVLGDVLYAENVDVAKKRFEITSLTVTSGKEIESEQDRMNFHRFEIWWKWDEEKWGRRVMVREKLLIEEWLGCKVKKEDKFYDFKGVYNVDSSKHQLYYVFFGRFYYRMDEDIVANCFFNVKVRTHNGTISPMKFYEPDGELDEEHMVRFDMMNRMFVKNLRHTSYYVPYVDTYKLSSRDGVLQARRWTIEQPVLLEELRKCSHNTLLVEGRYVFCFLEFSYRLIFDFSNPNTAINGREYRTEDLFYHLWPHPVEHRFVMAIFDWKDDYVVFLTHDWMFVFRAMLHF